MDFRGLVWKRAWKITFSGLKSGQDSENEAAHPHQEFPEVPPPPGCQYFLFVLTLCQTALKGLMPQKRKKKKKNEKIKLSQRRLSKLKEGFVGLLLKKITHFLTIQRSYSNCFWDLDLVGYVVEGKQNFGSAPWKIRKTNIILRIKCKNASTLLRRTNEKQIYNEKKEWKIYGWMNDLLINNYMYTNNWNLFVFHTIDKSKNLTTPVNHQNYLKYFRPWTVGSVRVLIPFIRDVLYCRPRDAIPLKIAALRVKVVEAIE